MANNIISQIKLPNGEVYNINASQLSGHSYEDIVALIDGSVQYLGLVSAVTGLSATASKGDFYRAAVDFDIAHAGDLIIALVDNPIQDITEDISVEAGWGVVHGGEFDMDHVHSMNHDHDFTFENANVSVSGTPQGTVAISVGTGTANYTPGGTIKLGHTSTATDEKGVHTHTYDKTTSATISVGTGTANYTPAGSVGTPTFTGKQGTTSEEEAHTHDVSGVTETENEAAVQAITKLPSITSGAITITQGTATKKNAATSDHTHAYSKATGIEEVTVSSLKPVNYTPKGNVDVDTTSVAVASKTHTHTVSHGTNTTQNAAPHTHTHTVTYAKATSASLNIIEEVTSIPDQIDSDAELVEDTYVSVVTDVTAALSATPTFTGTSATITSGTPSGTTTVANKEHTHTVAHTPAGTISDVVKSAASATLKNLDVTVTGNVLEFNKADIDYIQSVTIGKPTFTGTAATLTTSKCSDNVAVGSSGHTHSVTHKPAGTISKPGITVSVERDNVAVAEHQHSYAKASGVNLGHTNTTVTSSANSGSAVAAITALGAVTCGAPVGTEPVVNSVDATFAGTGAHLDVVNTSANTGVASGYIGLIESIGNPTATTPEITIGSPTTTAVARYGHTHDFSDTTTEAGAHSHTFTPEGTISKPTFTGTGKQLVVTLGHTSSNTGSAGAHTHAYDKTTSATFTGTGVVLKAVFTGSSSTASGVYQKLKDITAFSGNTGEAK